jgi:transcriptional regulator with XRE-family HTH domain
MEAPQLQVLGARIREARRARGWTQEALASAAGIDRSYVGGVERGERNPTFNTLCDICRALGCDVASITPGLPSVDE